MSSTLFADATDQMVLLDTLLGTTITNNNAFRLPVSEVVVAALIESGPFSGRFASPSITPPGDTSLIWPDKNVNPTVHKYWTGAQWDPATFDDIWSSNVTSVTAAAAFGTDNVLVRADGTGRGTQATGVVVDDSDNMSGLSSLRRGTTTGTMTVSGGSTTALGGNAVFYGEAHATQANDIELRSGATVRAAWDDSGGVWDFQGTNFTGLISARRGITNAGLTLSGGSTPTLGGNIIAYGESHATQADDIEFREGGTVRGAWDASSVRWNWHARLMYNCSDISVIDTAGLISTGTDQTVSVSGGSTTTLGGNAVFYGESHATQANDIQLRSGTTIRAAWDDSTAIWGFQSNTVGGVSTLVLNNTRAVRTDVTNSLISISGSNSITTGGNARFFGSTHATQANDIELRAGTTVRAAWDDSTAIWGFQGNTVGGVSTLVLNNTRAVRTDVTNSLINIAGGDTTTDGGNIRLYGSTHATQANDIELRSGATVKLHWDDSVGRWDFQDGIVVGISTLVLGNARVIRTDVTNSLLGIAGGSSATDGGNTRLFGSTHATQANDIELRSGTTVKLNWDDSAGTWGLNNTPLVGIARMDMNAGPEIHAGSGTPESAVTAPVGSIFLRSDGGTGTTLYVKESGAGNTGWIAK